METEKKSYTSIAGSVEPHQAVCA